MIQANELRIGNYYMYAGDNGIVYAKVKCIQFNEFGLLSDYDGVNFGICKPIPTEDFKKQIGGDKNVLVDYSGFVIFKNGYAYQFVFEDYPFIHQIQNLYFSLTNKELNIQL